jgi:carbamoyl-phosphate synthase large subunit
MNKKELNILFLGGAKRVSLAQLFKDYGKQKGLIIKIFSYELDCQVPIASEGNVIVGLKWTDPDILNHLRETISSYNIHIVLPFVDPAIIVASRLKKQIPNIFIPVSDEQTCEIMFDKRKSSDWFFQHDIPQPERYNPTNISYPAILKPVNGSASKGLIICRDKISLPKQIDFKAYLIQAFIEDGVEYSVDCYVDSNGQILSIVPRIRLEVSGGEAVKSMIIRDEEVITASMKILSSGSFCGPITIQFIKGNNNQVYVMEINPRLGGAVVASIGAGSGMISFILGEALHEPLFPIYDWKDRTLMTRYFKEVIFYADNN